MTEYFYLIIALERLLELGISFVAEMAWPVTEIVAWWGAIVSTVVLVWDVIKWRLAGPKLRLSVNSGMKTMNVPEYEGKTLISANVVNYGDRSTTLTHLAFIPYTNLWNRLRRRAENNLLILNPNVNQPLPHELKPGLMWHGLAVQDKKLEELARDGYLICAVFHTHRKRPVKKRVTIKYPREP